MCVRVCVCLSAIISSKPHVRSSPIFTARCYASAVLAISLCPSVCPSQVGVLLTRLNVGSHKQHHTIAQGTVVFRSQRSPRNSTGVTSYGGAKCRWGGSKSATFDKSAVSRKRYKIDAWFLLKSNRKSYALYRMATLPMTLSAPNRRNHPIFCILHRRSLLRNG